MNMLTQEAKKRQSVVKHAKRKGKSLQENMSAISRIADSRQKITD